jgi:hypothetical protein
MEVPRTSIPARGVTTFPLSNGDGQTTSDCYKGPLPGGKPVHYLRETEPLPFR